MMDKRILLICCCLFSIPFLMEYPGHAIGNDNRFHADWEVRYFEGLQDSLPTGFNGLFAASGTCNSCHGFDTAGIASVDFFGNDINVVDDWRSTIMANSSKDPFWRAKVSHEVMLYPQHAEVIETKCTSCHAPLGHFAAMHSGETVYTMEQMASDTFALDGVSCLACHQQTPENTGNLHSGEILFDSTKVAYGPYTSPLASPMVQATGYTPKLGAHIGNSGTCAGCHTLITETIDYDGNFTGNKFVEQATYHEWLNSDYPAEEVSCQGCHLAELDKWGVYIAAGFETPARMPFAIHDMAGANVFMLKLLKNNIQELDLKASAEQFDETIAATEDMLLNRSIGLDLSLIERTADTAYFEVEIANIAGHKFPTGYPSRRAFIEFLVENEFGDTLFISGRTDENFEVYGHHPSFETHYDTIRSEEEVQIYELVLADVNDEVTTVLERAEYALKDNRIPPRGFSTSHEVYDTTLIAGMALMDANFNIEPSGEGSGADKIYYHIPMNEHFEGLVVSCKVFYQTVPPKWMEEMFAEQSPEIDAFRTMFDAADRNPILIKSTTEEVEALMVSTEKIEEQTDFVRMLSNQSKDGIFSIISDQRHDYFIYDATGRLLKSEPNKSTNYQIQFNYSNGIYFIQFVAENGHTITKKIVHQN